MDDARSSREKIRAWRLSRGRRLAVLDDDPTGSQSVHDVQVVTVFDDREYASALEHPDSVAFILTNTRSLPEAEAVDLNAEVTAALLAIDPDLDLVSRSDSTLRGHVLAEVRAIDDRRALSTGRRFDGILFAPAFFEAGRFTSGDVHFATIGGEAVPVADSEFSRDATFGYGSSDLREFVVEKSGGAVALEDVLSISLETIREGGVDAVLDVLLKAHDGGWVIVNATDYDDYETVVLAVQAAIDAGRSYLFRTGPSFVRALAGLEPRAPLAAADLTDLVGNDAHGLIVVGSHVSQTSRQVAQARATGSLVEIEVSVPRILAGDGDYLAGVIRDTRSALRNDDVLVYTSRDLVAGPDAAASLDIARAVSAAVSRIVAAALDSGPAWVIAKGGITSHDVAVHGLGMRRARVVGQLLPGLISLFDPVSASPPAVGMPYVVFAGNVGDDDTLAHVVSVLRAAQRVTRVNA